MSTNHYMLVAVNGCGCLAAVANVAPELNPEEWLDDWMREHDSCRIDRMEPDEFERRYKRDGSWWDGTHCERHREKAASS